MNSRTHFRDCFWGGDISGSGGYDVLKKKVADGKSTCKAFEEFAKARATAEESYGKAILSAVRKLQDAPEVGNSTLGKAFESLRVESEKMAKTHIENGEQFSESALRMRDFIERQKNEKTARESTLDRAITDKKLQLKKTQDMKRLYENKSDEADQARSIHDRAKPSESQYPTKEWDKIFKHFTKTEREAKDACTNYRTNVDQLEGQRQRWEKEMEAYCELIELMEEARIKMLQNEIWLISNIISAACVLNDDCCENVRYKVEKIDSDFDIQTFMSHHKTGTERPAPVKFEQHMQPGAGLNTTQPYDSSTEQRCQPHYSSIRHPPALPPGRPPPPGGPTQQSQPIFLQNRSYQQ